MIGDTLFQALKTLTPPIPLAELERLRSELNRWQGSNPMNLTLGNNLVFPGSNNGGATPLDAQFRKSVPVSNNHAVLAGYSEVVVGSYRVENGGHLRVEAGSSLKII